MATFGNTTAETGSLAGWPDEKIASKFTLPVAGLVSKLTGYISNASSACYAKGIIYSDNSGVPNALQGAGSNATSIPVNGSSVWFDFTFATPISLAAGVYWLGCIGDSAATAFDLRANTSAAAGSGNRNADTYSDGPDASWGTNFPATWSFAIYATYTTASDRTPLIQFGIC